MKKRTLKLLGFTLIRYTYLTVCQQQNLELGIHYEIHTYIQEEFERIDEEEWPLQDVIFVEDSKNVPVGKVLKVDGPYCAVRFPTSAQETCHAVLML